MHRLRLPTLLIALLTVLAVAPAAHAADPAPPGASTGSVSAITRTTATLAGTVDPKGSDTTYVFQYGTSTSYGLTTPTVDAGSGSGNVAATAAISNLTSYTTYHYRVVATNAAGVTRGSDRTFTTARTPKAPTLGTFSTKSIAANSAVPTGSVNPQGLATTVHLEFGPTTAYGTSTPDITIAASFSSRTAALTLGSLLPYTTYHYRVVATNASGVARGSDRSFRTLRAPTGVTLDPLAPAVDWKGSATVSGRVTGVGVGGIGVTVQRSDFPFTTTYSARTATAKSDGTFSTSIGPIYSTTRVRVITSAPYTAASGWATISSRVTVGIKTGAKTRTKIALSGRVFPLVQAGRATLRRLSTKGTWVRVARAGVRASGQYASRYTFTITRPKTTQQYRVVVAPNDGGAHVAGTSRTIAVRGRD